MNYRIIARLDIKGSNLVKGVHLEGLRVLGKPEEFAKAYYQSGADELMYMDIVASLYNRNSLHEIISKTAKEIFIPLTVGGGLRTLDDIRDVLRSGADKVALNTAAIKNPKIIQQAASKFGSSTIVISIEAKKTSSGKYEAYIDNGREKTGVDVFQWAKQSESLGAGEIIITSIDREGTGLGFDLELIKKITHTVGIPVIAGGGAGNKDHVRQIFQEAEADAVSLASLIHYNLLQSGQINITKSLTSHGSPFSQHTFSKINNISIQDLKRFLLDNKINCRI